MNSKMLVRNLLPYGLVIHLSRTRSRRQRAKKLAGYARTSTPLPRLNMGCGPHFAPGWANLDGGSLHPNPFTLTIDTPLPFGDGSLEVVFSEHFLEHLELPLARHFIRESARVLRPDGLFRVSCPDLEAIARYVTEDGHQWQELARFYEGMGDFPEGCSRPEIVVNWAFYGNDHRHLWTLAALTDELTKAGFSEVDRMPYGVSRVEGAAIEVRRGEAFMSLIAEAVKR